MYCWLQTLAESVVQSLVDSCPQWMACSLPGSCLQWMVASPDDTDGQSRHDQSFHPHSPNGPNWPLNALSLDGGQILGESAWCAGGMVCRCAVRFGV